MIAHTTYLGTLGSLCCEPELLVPTSYVGKKAVALYDEQYKPSSGIVALNKKRLSAARQMAGVGRIEQ